MEKEETVVEVVQTATTAIFNFKDEPVTSTITIVCLVLGILVTVGVIKKKPWMKFFDKKKK